MLREQRHTAILRELAFSGTVNTTELATKLGASEATIRRDLLDLDRAGRLQRVHGGATARSGVPARPASLASASAVLASGLRSTPRLASGQPLARIGMIAPTAEYYFGPIIQGARDAARVSGVRLVLAVSNYDTAVERSQLARMIATGVDGILLTPARADFGGDSLRSLIDASPVPIVLVERASDPASAEYGRIESVRSDHAFGMELALRHLTGLGHRRVVLLSPGHPSTPALRSTYLQLEAPLGIERVWDDPFPDTGSWQPGVRQKRMLELLHELTERHVEALVIHPEMDAVEFTQMAISEGLSVPDDLSIVSYDDEVASLAEVPLTAVAPPKYDIGYAALSMCLRRVASADQRRLPVQDVLLMPTLNIRGSTARYGRFTQGFPGQPEAADESAGASTI